jgi:hypothetical protein
MAMGLGGRARQWHARQTAGHLGRVRRGRRCGTRSQGVGAKGNGWLVARDGGNRANTDAEAAWCPARGTAKPAGRPARCRRSRARPTRFAAGQPYFDCVFLQKIELCEKMVDMKVVDETSLYNICKGRPMFFSTV